MTEPLLAQKDQNGTRGQRATRDGCGRRDSSSHAVPCHQALLMERVPASTREVLPRRVHTFSPLMGPSAKTQWQPQTGGLVRGHRLRRLTSRGTSVDPEAPDRRWREGPSLLDGLRLNGCPEDQPRRSTSTGGLRAAVLGAAGSTPMEGDQRDPPYLLVLRHLRECTGLPSGTRVGCGRQE